MVAPLNFRDRLLALLNMPYDYAPKNDLVIQCADGEKLTVSSKILVQHSKFFEAMLTGKFKESKLHHYKRLTYQEIKIDQFSKKILNAVNCFFETKHLPTGELLNEEELLILNDAVDFFALKSENEDKEFKDAILEEIKTNYLTRESAISWYNVAIEMGNFPDLRIAALNALRGELSGTEFLSIIKDAQETFTPVEYRKFLWPFVRKCTIDYTGCNDDQNKDIYAILKVFGSTNQINICMSTIAGEVNDADMFTVLESEGEAEFEDLNGEESRKLCMGLLIKRLDGWLMEIGSNGDYRNSNNTILGKKRGLFIRTKLPRNAVSNIRRFAKMAHLLKDDEDLRKLINEYPPIQKNWLLSKLTR